MPAHATVATPTAHLRARRHSDAAVIATLSHGATGQASAPPRQMDAGAGRHCPASRKAGCSSSLGGRSRLASATRDALLTSKRGQSWYRRNHERSRRHPRPNLPEYSVSEIAAALKRTVEDAFPFVRVRGEISSLKFHSSGHIYFDLKDDKACLNAVVWRMTARLLKVKPEQGWR